jgi:hypothetical protein
LKTYIIIFDIVLFVALLIFFGVIYKTNQKRKKERAASGIHYTIEIVPLQTWGSYFLAFCYLLAALFLLHFGLVSQVQLFYVSLMFLIPFVGLLIRHIAADLLNRIYISDRQLLQYQGLGAPRIILVDDIKHAFLYNEPNTLRRYFPYLEITLTTDEKICLNKNNKSFLGLYYWLEIHKVPIHKKVSGRRKNNRRLARRDFF